MAQGRATLTGATSRGIVLDLIRSRGPISRVQLATATGFTQATISHVVRSLASDGLVVESGEREYTGGKPRVMLTLAPRARFAVGVQLGADSTTYVVTDVTGTVVGRLHTRGVRTGEPAESILAIAARIERLLAALDVDPSLVLGIGVATPGPLDLERGCILRSPTMPAWVGFPLRERLAAATGLSVSLDNDATAAGVGEFWGGDGASSVAHCTVFMGAGIGAGIIVGGTVYRGSSSNAGEIGQLRALRSEPGATIESVAAPAAVAAAARRAIASGRATSMVLGEGDAFADFDVVAASATRGDPLALELIAESAEHIGDAVVTLADILDLDSVVLAGPSFSIAGPLYLRAVQRRVDAEFFARELHGVRVQLSHHVVDAAAVGAATLVLQQQLSPRRFGIGAFAAAP